MMEQDTEYRQQVVDEYKQAVVPLLRYIPWFERNEGQPGSTLYQGEDFTEHSMGIPVYDATLLNFVREASKSSLMDRNYLYTYSRGRIRTHEDERKVIASAELKDWDVLRGILSKYVMGGMTKSTLWAQGVQENIFLLVLRKMQEIIEFWDQPLDIR